MLMFTLSMLQSMNAMKHNAMMVHRRFHLLGVLTACNDITFLDDHRLSVVSGELPDSLCYQIRLFGIQFHHSCQRERESVSVNVRVSVSVCVRAEIGHTKHSSSRFLLLLQRFRRACMSG